uniref:Uncharacterized protein n=1 Tax=Oryza meridionalis TaxID=40149 RepID=A0A0E0E591_9ORYZ
MATTAYLIEFWVRRETKDEMREPPLDLDSCLMTETAKDAADLEKAIGVMVDAAAQAEAMAGDQKEALVPADLLVQGGDAKKPNQHARKKWLRLWLIVVWVMILTNHFFIEGGHNVDAESNGLYFALVMFIGLLCAICLMFRALK